MVLQSAPSMVPWSVPLMVWPCDCAWCARQVLAWQALVPGLAAGLVVCSLAWQVVDIRKNLIYLIGLSKSHKDAKTEKDIKCN